MIIERTSKEIIFRLPSSTKLEELQDIADLFTFKEISQKSKAKQKDVDDLVKKIKKRRWAKTKKKIGLKIDLICSFTAYKVAGKKPHSNPFPRREGRALKSA